LLKFSKDRHRYLQWLYQPKGRDIVKSDEGYHLREEAAPYMALFEAEKDDIGTENTYFGDINT